MTQSRVSMALKVAPPSLLHLRIGPIRAAKLKDLLHGFGERRHMATLRTLELDGVFTPSNLEVVFQSLKAGCLERHVGVATEPGLPTLAAQKRDTLGPAFVALGGHHQAEPVALEIEVPAGHLSIADVKVGQRLPARSSGRLFEDRLFEGRLLRAASLRAASLRAASLRAASLASVHTLLFCIVDI